MIPSGVDTERFAPTAVDRAAAKRALGLPEGAPAIGTVGRLEARKGTRTLIEALARLDGAIGDAHLVVAGDGPLREELAGLAARLGVADRVRLLGNRDDVRDVLAALDVFALPSLTEGMSNALLEAMAMALPLVATAVGGNPEVVTDAEHGLLVPPGDPEPLARAIGRLLANREDGARMGAAARRRVEERYGARAMVRELEGVYAAVAARAARADAATATAAKEPA